MPAMEVVVKILESEGVEFIFGIPGGAINPFYQALSKSRKIKNLTFRDELGMTNAADGYARVTGKVGVTACIGGPGGAVALAGIYSAFTDSSPLICINGDIPSGLRGKEGTVSININELCEPVAKRTYYVQDANQLPTVFRESFRIAREGRPGPVVIEVSVDTQRQEIVYDPDTDAPLKVSVRKPSSKKIEKAVDMLLKAKNPLILLGGGAVKVNASDDLVKLAEHLALPIISTIMGKGGISPDHPLYAGQVGTRISIPPGNEIFLGSDVVLAVGVRFGDRHTGDTSIYKGNRQFIHVEVEPSQIGRTIPADLAIISDAKLAAEDLLKVAKKKSAKREPSIRVAKIPEMRKMNARKDDFDNIPLYPQRVFREMNEFFDEDTAYVTTIGLVQMLSGQFQKVYKPKRYFINSGFGCLGWDLPASIGVKVGNPELKVVDIVGDFGFSYSSNQLAVASQYGVPIIVAIINDGYLGLIRQNQELSYGFHYGIDIVYDRIAPRLTDFVKLAEAYGIAGERVSSPEKIKSALERALQVTKDSRPYLIDFITESVDASTGLRIDKVIERGYRVNPITPAKVELEIPPVSRVKEI